MADLRIGIVGTGYTAGRHAEGYARIAGARVVGCVGRRAERAARFAATLEGDRVWFCNGLVNSEAGVVTSQPTISSVPKSGGPITRREMPFQVHGLAADGRWIYLSEFPGPARLRRIPK